MSSPIEDIHGGALLTVKVVPRASRSEVAGLHGDSIRIRLGSPPVDGKANRELLRFLAARLEIPSDTVELITRGSSRIKRVRVYGLTGAEVVKRLGLTPARHPARNPERDD